MSPTYDPTEHEDEREERARRFSPDSIPRREWPHLCTWSAGTFFPGGQEHGFYGKVPGAFRSSREPPLADGEGTTTVETRR